MSYYVPGSEEKDPAKVIMSLQQAHSKTATNTTDIATNTTNIATNTSDIASIQAAIAGPPWGTGTVTNVATAGLATGGPITTTGTVTVTAASKSDQTTATSNVVAVTPLHQQDHDSACKAWVKFANSGINGAQTINASYNVTSVSRNGLGDFTITFTTAFSSVNYACTGSIIAGTHSWVEFGTQAAGSVHMLCLTTAAAFGDPTSGFASFFGRQ